MEARRPRGRPRIRMLENVQNGDPLWNCQEERRGTEAVREGMLVSRTQATTTLKYC